MTKLRDIFPQFPNDGDQIEFLGKTFRYFQELNYWTDKPAQEVDQINFWSTSIHAAMTIYFSKENFDWNTFSAISANNY